MELAMDLSPRQDVVTPFPGPIIPVSPGGTQVIITDALMLGLTTLWVGFRVYARRMKRMNLQLEDYMLLVALLFFYVLVIASFLMVYLGGLGHHLNALGPKTITMLLKISLVTQVFYALSLGMVKCSICLLLARIFFVRPFVIAARAAMCFAASWALMTFLIGILICKPIEMNWNPAVEGGSCGNQNAAFTSVGIVDIITDLIILVLPMPMVYKLQVPRANKIGLCCIFGTGLLTMAFGIVRVIAVLNVDFTDFSASAKESHIFSVAEAGVALIVACSPTLRPIFDKIFRTISHLSSGTKSNIGNAYISNGTGRSNTNADGFMEMGDEVALKSMGGRSRNGRIETRITASGTSSEEYLSEERDVKGTNASPFESQGIYVKTTVDQS